MSAFALLMGYAKPYMRPLKVVGALSAVEALLGIAPFLIMYVFITALLREPVGSGEAWGYAAAVFVSVAGKAGLRWYVGVEVHKVGYWIVYDIRSSLAEHMGMLPMSFFNKNNTGALHKAVMEDAERVETLFCHNLPDLAAALVTPVFCLIVMFVVDWRLALFAVIPFPLAVGCQALMMRECARKIEPYHNAMTEMSAGVQEYVRGMATVRAFNRTVFSFKAFYAAVTGFRTVVDDWSRTASKYYALFQTALGTGLLFVLPSGIWLLYDGGLRLPDLVLFLMLTVGYAQPLERLLSFAAKIREMEEGVRRIDVLLREPGFDTPTIPRVPEGDEVVFDHVVFGYEKEQPLFSDLSLRIQADAVTAFVGPSGAGKTTAALLIARYHDVSRGAVRIGGVDVREINPKVVMERVSLVFQDTFLFNSSLRENIRCAKPEASDAEVEEAARRAHADEFIRRLPNGYETPAGEVGTPLSGGERQRIAIARAILRNTPIVILDEATAYADPETEVLIQASLAELLRGKTVIVVAHSLNTVTQCDAIVVFDAGQVVGMGRHEELLEGCDTYKAMWEGRKKAKNWSFAMQKNEDGARG